MAAGSGETARPASGKYVFGAHRPAAWQLTISLGKFLISSREAAMRRLADHDFSWAHYDFKPAPGDPLHTLHWPRIVIFERLPAATLRPILISGDDAAFGYDKPRILHAGGRVVLHLPAYESGTGNFNRELLYVWANDAWHDADVTAWHDELDHRLPKGLVILKGVYPDYEKITAETPVWRRSHRGGPRWHRQSRRMRRSLAALSSAGLPAGRPKGTNAMTGSFHIEPWDAPPKS
jgi:hypothetical protein